MSSGTFIKNLLCLLDDCRLDGLCCPDRDIVAITLTHSLHIEPVSSHTNVALVSLVLQITFWGWCSSRCRLRCCCLVFHKLFHHDVKNFLAAFLALQHQSVGALDITNEKCRTAAFL